MRKYERLRQLLLAEEIVAPEDLRDAPLATTEELLRVHDAGYVARVDRGELSDRELRRLGFPWTPALPARARASVGATLAASRAALAEGLGVNLAGGTHHAGADHGSGYCVYNDFAVAAADLLACGLAGRVLVLDLDVHQGDGTARLLAGEARAFTVSLHGRDNFPYRKAASDLDVALPSGTGDDAYLDALDLALGEARRRFGTPHVVLYLAGADPHEEDRFGRLGLTLDGLRRRDERVAAEFAGHVPVVVAMGGGYGRDVETVARIHATTVSVLSAASARPPAA